MGGFRTARGLKAALALWVLLLALAPYLHKPLVHPGPEAEMAHAFCGTEPQDLPFLPDLPRDAPDACPVFALLQAFGTHSVPAAPAIAAPAGLAAPALLSAAVPAPAAAAPARTDLQPRAPPTA